MATISNTPRPGYVWDSTDNVWYPIGVGNHNHSEIAKTIVDAKGDLIVGTANDTVARQAVGTDGQMLVASSAQTNGVAWADQPITAGKNAIINGGFDIWQRGTSSTNMNSGYYTADRWKTIRSGNVAGYTVSRQTTFQAETSYAIRLQRTASNTTTDAMFLAYAIETLDWTRYQGKAVTFSFYAKGGANYSPTSGNLGVTISTGTGTDQDPLAALTGEVAQIATNAIITTTATRYSYTFTVPSNSTDMRLYFSVAPTGTAGAADYVDITGVQLELGSIATPFSRAGGTIQGELAACQRYYVRFNPSAGSTYAWFGNGIAYANTACYSNIVLPTTMRTKPATIEQGGTLVFSDGVTTSSCGTLSIESNLSTENNLTAYYASTSGLTQYRMYGLRGNNNSATYIGVGAEL